MKKDIIALLLVLLTVALEKIITEHYINAQMTIYLKDIILYLLIIELGIYLISQRKREKKIAQMRIGFFKKYGNYTIDVNEFNELYNRKELRMLGFKDE